MGKISYTALNGTGCGLAIAILIYNRFESSSVADSLTVVAFTLAIGGAVLVNRQSGR